MESGFDVNIRNERGLTPLMRAIKNSCSYEVIQLLIKFEANVNMLTLSGLNMFDYFAFSSSPPYRFTNVPIVKLILISGFDLKLLTDT